MPEAVIVSAVRTAIGKKNGALAKTRADELLAHEMEKRDVRYGVSTMCIGFGQATATLLDRRV